MDLEFLAETFTVGFNCSLQILSYKLSIQFKSTFISYYYIIISTENGEKESKESMRLSGKPGLVEDSLDRQITNTETQNMNINTGRVMAY